MLNIITYISIVCFLFLILFLIVIYSVINGISPLPSTDKAINLLIQELKKRKISGPIYELGSGWGSVTVHLSKEFPHCDIICYENSIIPYYVSVLRKKMFSCRNVVILRKNFYKAPLKDASVIYCYLYPQAMNLLEEKFKKEFNEKVLVISNTFALPNQNFEKKIELNDI